MRFARFWKLPPPYGRRFPLRKKLSRASKISKISIPTPSRTMIKERVPTGETNHPTVVKAFDRICDAVASKSNVKLGAFARDARDGHAWTRKGASFVALASTLLIAQKFREVIDDLQSADR